MRRKFKNSAQRILIVDDDQDTLTIVKRALEIEGYQTNSAVSGSQAIDLMDEWFPHLVLLDVNMPELDGLETLKYLRKKNEWVSTVFISGKTNVDDVVVGLDAGADDYIKKPLDIRELLARVRCQLRIKQLHDDLRIANEKLSHQVEIDDLTGLFNMKSIPAKIENELARARRYGRNIAVIMMDMDKFKMVNDNHDHLFGSFVLAEVGALISNNIRKVDFAARYGGDEFLIVLTEVDLAGVLGFTRRFKELVKDYEFRNEEHHCNLTVSLGFAISTTEANNINSTEIMKAADRALYAAKHSGRNCIRYIEIGKDGDEVQIPLED
ncbi:MAG: diguanylate cyclase [Bdellovibrionales bacterium]|nr:diguanylate cyclase [Bdellovibrionales bacterium]